MEKGRGKMMEWIMTEQIFVKWKGGKDKPNKKLA
jgi:hypothetical protein